MKTRRTVLISAALLLLGIAIYQLYQFYTDAVTAEVSSPASYSSPTKDWRILFSEEMNPDTFTEDRVAVTDQFGDHVSISLQWDRSNTILTIQPPKNGYTAAKQHQLWISEQVESNSGSNLSAPLEHIFTPVAGLPAIQDGGQLKTLLKERGSPASYSLFTEQAETSSDAAEPAGNGHFSETNIQVDGIDEGDRLKNDGDYLYFAREGDIIISSADGSNSNVQSTITEDHFHPTELFLHKDYLISIGSSTAPLRPKTESETEVTSHEDMAVHPSHTSHTSIYIYDIKDKHDPVYVKEVTVEGRLLSARKMDGHLYLAASHQPYRIMETGEEGRPYVKDSSIHEEGVPLPLEDMYYFPDSNAADNVLLTSINLEEPDVPAEISSYLGAAHQLYMSKDHLYLAAERITEKNIPEQEASSSSMIANPLVDTEVFQFQLSNGDINYSASAVVQGTLLNQFSMDERDSTFRLATTKSGSGEADSSNNLYTFSADDLTPLGSIEGLAKGERIYSVRFMQDIAYMVTFRQIDPLFAIDLSDPAQPEVLGELKIPGFSNYLHPLDDGHVAGFGQETILTEPPGGGEPIVEPDGIKISIFDVSNPAEPKEKFTEVIGQGGSYTELNHNHKALFHHPNSKLYGFPAALFETKTINKDDISYREQSYVFEGALLYELDTQNGITLFDTISHQAEGLEHPVWKSEVKRIASSDGYLYTFSYDQIKVYDLKEKQITQTLSLPDFTKQNGY
ncbi:beta-propeller domain-containing protein [Virgibacillus sediminis]|uniref:Beta-propeller domain-containing protein n=1 Tax=Virgibacillus sediminis TaxID=202260 RepID=A0ABV7AA53_9BACI